MGKPKQTTEDTPLCAPVIMTLADGKKTQTDIHGCGRRAQNHDTSLRPTATTSRLCDKSN